MSNNIKPLREGNRKNNQEKPSPVVKKSDVAKPPAAISNNKQSMKLYTEEQMLKVWKAGQEYWKTSGASITLEELLEHETPITLPSDEEIERELESHEHMTLELEAGFRAGVKMVINKIQGGNK